MTTFNFNEFLKKASKEKDQAHIDEALRKERGGDKEAPDSITEDQLSSGSGKEGETTTEERLEKVRTGGGDVLVEGMLNSSKSKLHTHRNEKASSGDINKLEEQRMANKDRQETEKQEPSSETGKKNSLLGYDTSKDDGLKLATWDWKFGKTAKVVARNSPSAMYYCKNCGATYDVKPSMAQGGQMCEDCGGDKIAEIPRDKISLQSPEKSAPIPLDLSKSLPKLQSSKDKIVTAQWEFSDDSFERDEASARRVLDSDPSSLDVGGDSDLTPGAMGELFNPAFDLKGEEDGDVDFSDDGDKQDKFEENIVGTSSPTGTTFQIVEVSCLDLEQYENDVGQLEDSGKTKLITDIMEYIVDQHPELRDKITSKMLNTSKIMDGKVFFLKAK